MDWRRVELWWENRWWWLLCLFKVRFTFITESTTTNGRMMTMMIYSSHELFNLHETHERFITFINECVCTFMWLRSLTPFWSCYKSLLLRSIYSFYYYCFSAVLVTTKSILLIGEKKRTREEGEQRRQTRGEGRTLSPLHNTYVYSISSELMIIREASDDTERKRWKKNRVGDKE